jgi:hypothetical protein
MSEERKDHRLKYIELPREFMQRANDVDITSKQHLRYCHKLAEQLSRRKAKTPDEFEKLEAMKDFVIKTSELNEKTIELLKYVQSVLQQIADDTEKMAVDAIALDQLRDQSDTIEYLTKQRETLITEIYARKKADFARH